MQGLKRKPTAKISASSIFTKNSVVLQEESKIILENG